MWNYILGTIDKKSINYIFCSYNDSNWFIILIIEDVFGEYDLLSFIEEIIREGGRPEIPDFCPKEYKDIIELCWVY
jgi:hypothetical protein